MANYISALTGAAMDDALQQMNNRVPEGWAVGERDGVPVGEESLYYHNNAKYYAEQAQAQAESAEESAESASQVAQETADAVIAQAFVQESAEVGSIVTIDDGADNIPLKDLKVNLDIVQPGTGDPSPTNVRPIYPVTEAEVSRTGKNILYFPDLIATATQNGDTVTISVGSIIRPIVSVGKGVTLTWTRENYIAGSGTTGLRIDCLDENKNVIDTFTMVSAQKTIAGVYFIHAQYSSVSGGATIVKPQIELGSTATAYEPYAGQQYLVNIGINQFDKTTAVANSRWTNGGASTASGTTRSALIPVIPNTSYYFKNIYTAHDMTSVYWFDASGAYISSGVPAYATGGNVSFTSPANASFVGINFNTANLDTVAVNYPSRFTDYFPFTGNVVYGGELDVTTGVLTDEFPQKVTFTGTENWLLDTQYHNRYSAFYVAQNTLARMIDYRGSIVASNMMTIQRAGAAFDSEVNTIAITGYSNSPSSTTNYLYIIVDNQAEGYEGITTADALKTWLGNNNVEVAFRVQTPLTIQLTPTEVDTLRGDNVIWADCGDITNCEYRADLKLYIDKVVG